jgi:ADP-ribose pyrophosphatase YjhB (NUDIX family)
MTLPGIWPPPTNPVRIDRLDLRMADGPHPFYTANRAQIEANWIVESAANPHLFNGQMVLQQALSFDGGVIHGIAHAIPYSALLWWRRQPEAKDALHLFGFAVPVSSDGAIIAIRMSERTASPGRVYCAAGSLDLSDVVDGKLDIDANMHREVREETGLDLATAQADPCFHAGIDRTGIVVFRFYRFAMTAEEMVAHIEAHMLREREPEIAGAVTIRSADRDARPYSPAMYPILDMFFAPPDN